VFEGTSVHGGVPVETERNLVKMSKSAAGILQVAG
jgi:hypothetical protein